MKLPEAIAASVLSAERGEPGQVFRAREPGRRDPALAALLRNERARRSITVAALADAAWRYYGVPLAAVEVHRVERAARHPTPWCLQVYLEVLQPSKEVAEEIIRRWGNHPKYADLGLNLEKWSAFLRSQPPPLPVTRRAQPDKLHTKAGGLVTGNVKVRFTQVEDVLVNRAVKLLKTTMSGLVRSALQDAIEYRRTFKGRPAEGVRTEDHTIRLDLSPALLKTIEDLSHGVELAAWTRLAVLDYVESGRAMKGLKALV